MPSPTRVLLIVAMTGLLLAGVSCGDDKKDETSVSTTTTTSTTKPRASTSTTSALPTTTFPGQTTSTTDPFKVTTSTTTTGPVSGSDPNSPECTKFDRLNTLNSELNSINPKTDMDGFKAKYAEFNQAFQDFAKAPPAEISQPFGVAAKAFADLQGKIAATKTVAELDKVLQDSQLDTGEASAAITQIQEYVTRVCGSL